MGLKSFFEGAREGIGLFGHTIAIIINSALLTIAYLLGVGLSWIFAKLSKQGFLELEPGKKAWKDLDLKKKPLKEYYKQF